MRLRQDLDPLAPSPEPGLRRRCRSQAPADLYTQLGARRVCGIGVDYLHVVVALYALTCIAIFDQSSKLLKIDGSLEASKTSDRIFIR